MLHQQSAILTQLKNMAMACHGRVNSAFQLLQHRIILAHQLSMPHVQIHRASYPRCQWHWKIFNIFLSVKHYQHQFLSIKGKGFKGTKYHSLPSFSISVSFSTHHLLCPSSSWVLRRTWGWNATQSPWFVVVARCKVAMVTLVNPISKQHVCQAGSVHLGTVSNQYESCTSYHVPHWSVSNKLKILCWGIDNLQQHVPNSRKKWMTCQSSMTCWPPLTFWLLFAYNLQHLPWPSRPPADCMLRQLLVTISAKPILKCKDPQLVKICC